MNTATILILILLLLASIFCQPSQRSATIIEDAKPVTETAH